MGIFRTYLWYLREKTENKGASRIQSLGAPPGKVPPPTGPPPGPTENSGPVQFKNKGMNEAP